MKSTVFTAAAGFGLASAQVAVWGQCGGINYSGSTTCASGNTCSKLNDYYYQCLPGGSGGAATTAPAATTARPTTTAAAAQTTTAAAQPTQGSGSGSSSGGSYAKAVGTKFSIDGVTGYFKGTNSYWISFLTNNADVDLVMKNMKSNGLKILRVWGFNDVSSTPGSGTVWFQSFVKGQSPVINTGSNGLQRLDYVVKAAEANGIKLIIPFVNNWNDYGGMNAYVQYYGLANNQAWYTSSAAQAQYQAYIKAVVSRYSTSTAIFAWELANEPRCNGCPTSTMTNWITTTSKYIKSLDSNHMVTLGDEGMGLSTGSDGSYPYGSSEGQSWTTNLAIPSIDFGTYHLYPESWSVSPADTWGNNWISNHAKACAAANKPCMAEEYGVTTNKCSVEGGWQKTAVGSTTAADLFWQIGQQLSSGQSPNDGFTIYQGTSDWTCLVTNHP